MNERFEATDKNLAVYRNLLARAQRVQEEIGQLDSEIYISKKEQFKTADTTYILIPSDAISLPPSWGFERKYGMSVESAKGLLESGLKALNTLLTEAEQTRRLAVEFAPKAPQGLFRRMFWRMPVTWQDLENYRRSVEEIAKHSVIQSMRLFTRKWTTSFEGQLKDAFIMDGAGRLLKPKPGTQEAFAIALPSHERSFYSVLNAKQLQMALAGCTTLSQTKPQKEDIAAPEISKRFRIVRQSRAFEILDNLRIEKLREATTGKLQLSSELSKYDLTTVGDIYRIKLQQLIGIPGVGERTASRMKAAAQTFYNEEYNSNDYRIGNSGTRAEKEIVFLLRNYEERCAKSETMKLLAEDLLEPLENLSINQHSSDFVLVSPTQGARLTLESDLKRLSEEVRVQKIPEWSTRDLDSAWKDYKSNPARYQALLAKLFNLDSIDSSLEYLDKNTIEAIRNLQLDTSLMRSTFVRGYQQFAAKFLVVQRKMLLGDEMGLGKTLQAISAAAHVSAGLKKRKLPAHVLVVAPASLIINWEREIEKFSLMKAFVAHGPQRNTIANDWGTHGGMLVTTYDTLKTLSLVKPAMVIVDEAHMVKNPDAQRTKAVLQYLRVADYAMLLTGTPIENKLDEFSTLITYLDPQIGQHTRGINSPKLFRQAIAPVYLRRNQKDVLDELPAKVEVTDWVELTDRDQQIYRSAIAEGAWMAARRAAIIGGADSAKMNRIRELVNEAEVAGRNVIIFSYFRDVLDLLQQQLRQVSVGVIDGSITAQKRQELVDQLGKAGHVLLAQITAGGVGLNIQHSSVVIFAEVQVKPSLEDQAIARAHRMGQINVVNVHRIVGRNTVDEKLLEITASKREIFDKFAREAASAHIYDAKDITEIKIAQSIIQIERERLGIKSAVPVKVFEQTQPTKQRASRSAQKKPSKRR